MVYDNLHARKVAGHLFQHGHLVRQDVEVEHRAQALRLAPKGIKRFRAQPCRLRMVKRAETHPLKSTLFAPERLRYWIKERGFQCMRFSPLYHPQSTWLSSKALYPLWREAERLGAVFNFYILPHQMPMLEEMASHFPGVKIVVDHLGEPDLKAADPWQDFRKMFRLKKFSQVWISASEPYEISLTQFPYHDIWPFFKAVYQEFG